MPTQTIEKSAGVLALEQLRKGLDNELNTHWPGVPEFKFLLVPLSVDEMQIAQAKAEKRFKHIGLELSFLNADDFSGELHVQVLAVSIRDKEDRSKRLFRTPADFRENSTADERTALTSDFISLQANANPIPEEMSDELFLDIERTIKKKDVIQLSSIGSRTLANYLLSLESRQES